MDTEYFDYQECDNNDELDDLDAIGQDAQDAYFSDACMEEDDEAPARSRPVNRSEAMKRMQRASRGGETGHASSHEDLDY